MTRDELATDLTSYLDTQNPDFVARIDSFIKAAEDRVTEVLQLPSARVTAMGLLTAGTPNVVYPVGLRSVFAFAVLSAGTYSYLREVQPDFMRAAYPNPSVQGFPRRYAVRNATELVLGPTPDQAYTYSLEYEQQPVSLVASPTGTWLSQNCSNVLRWAAIIEGYTWQKGAADTMALYGDRFKEAMAQAQLLVDARLKSDNFRDGDGRLSKSGG